MQHPSVDLPTLLVVKNLQGTFLIQTSIFHLQTPTDRATEFVCNTQFSLESSPLLLKKKKTLWPYMCISRPSVMYRIWSSDLETEWKGGETRKKITRQTNCFLLIQFSASDSLSSFKVHTHKKDDMHKIFQWHISEYHHSINDFHRSQTRDYQ